MTIEEIKSQLRELIDDRKSLKFGKYCDAVDNEIYDNDIAALTAAINIIENAAVKHGTWVEKVPSRMKWIPDESDGITEETPIEDIIEQKCSVCKRWAIKFANHIEMNFCPSCGSKMITRENNGGK